jgi:preprotein translocase subunit YajC
MVGSWVFNLFFACFGFGLVFASAYFKNTLPTSLIRGLLAFIFFFLIAYLFRIVFYFIILNPEDKKTVETTNEITLSNNIGNKVGIDPNNSGQVERISD